MKNFLSTAVTGLAMYMSTSALAQPLMLITDEEARASIAAGGLPVPRTTPQPGAPRIELISPDLGSDVTVPTKIEIRFKADPPAELKPETFKAFYGAFRLDITQRLVGYAKVTKEGISVSDATLPSGRHQLLLTVTDSLGRATQQVISFTVK
jgi:hypothetical protein